MYKFTITFKISSFSIEGTSNQIHIVFTFS